MKDEELQALREKYGADPHAFSHYDVAYPEAVEAIRSLLAEVDRLKEERDGPSDILEAMGLPDPTRMTLPKEVKEVCDCDPMFARTMPDGSCRECFGQRANPRPWGHTIFSEPKTPEAP